MEMESNIVWSERFTLNLPPEISRDESELDYLRRTNMEAWAAEPKPRLKPAKVRKLRPIIIVRPILLSWAAEFFGHPVTAETTSDNIRKIDKHAAEELRRDSGVGMEDDDGVEIEFQSSKHPAEDCHCRRDSGIAIDNEDEQPCQDQAVPDKCCCNEKQDTIDEALFFDDDIDEAGVGLAV